MRVRKKRGKEKKKNDWDFWRRQSRQPCFTSSWLQLAGVLSDARSPSLSGQGRCIFLPFIRMYL